MAVIPLKSPEEAAREAVTQDLLWLTHEGYVIEYADTRLESVPPPKNPPKVAIDRQVTAAEQSASGGSEGRTVDAGGHSAI